MNAEISEARKTCGESLSISPLSPLSLYFCKTEMLPIGLHGVRMGALLPSAHFAQRAAEKISNLFFRIDTPRLAFLADVLSDSRLVEYLEDLNYTVAYNYQFAQQNLHPFLHLYESEAASVSMFSIKALGITDMEFVQDLLTNYQVGLIPGGMFYKTGREVRTDRVRIAFGRTQEEVRIAVERINSFVFFRSYWIIRFAGESSVG